MRWIVYDLFCLVFAMRTVKQNKSGGTAFHVTREQAQWLIERNVNPGDYFRAAVNVPAHERRALASHMAEEADERAIALKEERKAHEWAAIQYEEMHGLINEIVETSDPEHRGALCLQLGECYGEVGLDALAEAEESARIAMAMAKARDSCAGTIVIITERERAWDRVEVPADAQAWHLAMAKAEDMAKLQDDAREDDELWHIQNAASEEAWDAEITAHFQAEEALAAEIGLNLPNV
jgi:hypothetical protein